MSVTAPFGFRAAGVVAGLKTSGERDVAVVINDGPSRAAAAVNLIPPGRLIHRIVACPAFKSTHAKLAENCPNARNLHGLRTIVRGRLSRIRPSTVSLAD